MPVGKGGEESLDGSGSGSGKEGGSSEDVVTNGAVGGDEERDLGVGKEREGVRQRGGAWKEA